MSKSRLDPAGEWADIDARIVAALERISQALHRGLWNAAWAERLSSTQAQFLIYLFFHGQERVSINQLAERFVLRHSTVSDAVTALESKGLVKRASRKDDRRTTELILTSRGKRTAQELARWVESVRQQLSEMHGMDKAAFLSTLLDLIARLQQVGLISVVRTCTTCHYFERNRHADPAAPHHCRLLNQPLRLVELRVDCPDHAPVPASVK